MNTQLHSPGRGLVRSGSKGSQQPSLSTPVKNVLEPLTGAPGIGERPSTPTQTQSTYRAQSLTPALSTKLAELFLSNTNCGKKERGASSKDVAVFENIIPCLEST